MRILTAREQVEMLEPWTRQAASYWHLTDNPDFKPDPSHAPQLNTTMGDALGTKLNPGLFVSQTPDHWAQSYGYWKPYVSEIDVPDGVGEHHRSESYIPATDYDKIKVKRTIPLDAYAREQYNIPGWTEDDAGTSFDTGEPLPKHRGGFHDRNWDGRYQYPGTAMDQPEEWRTNYEQQVRNYQKKTPGIIA